MVTVLLEDTRHPVQCETIEKRAAKIVYNNKENISNEVHVPTCFHCSPALTIACSYSILDVPNVPLYDTMMRCWQLISIFKTDREKLA